MAIVGEATVVIRALTDRVGRDISSGIRASAPQIRAAGKYASQSFKDAFKRNGEVDGRSLFNRFNTQARTAGSRAGSLFGKAWSSGIERAMRSSESGLLARAGGMGGRIGNAFRSGFSRSGASRTFISIGLRIAALVPILGALVGAISNVVSGLFAIASAASSAAQSLVVIPSLLSAIIQAGGVMLAAFSGIGKAVTAGMQSASSSTSKAATDMKEKASDAAEAVRDAIRGVADAERNASRSIQDATRAVRDAKQNLKDTYRNAAEAERNAIQAVSDAEEQHVQALHDVTDAQEALNDARKEAKERLIDLQFASREGALAERRAAMELEDARWELNAASELPVDNRLRQEAQLAFEEAQLNMDEIVERNGDIAEEQKKAKKEGIEGSDEVTAAQEALIEAEKRVKDSAEAVTEALRQQREVARDNARAIQQAQEGVADSERNLADARRDGAESVRDAKEALSDARRAQDEANRGMRLGSEEAVKYADELAKLPPAAREFVKFLISIRGKLVELRTAAQEGMFPGLEEAIRTLLSGPLFPALVTMMRDTGEAVGAAAQKIAKDLSSGPFTESFGRVTAQNETTIRRLGSATGDLARIVFALLDASRPLVNQFTKWFAEWTDGLRVTVEAKNRTGELSDVLVKAGDRMKVIIRIVKNLAEGFFDLGKIGDDQGMRLLRVFERSTEAFADFTDKASNRKMLREFFKNTADNFIALSSLVKEVGAAFFRLGADPAIGRLSTALEPTIKKIEKLITTMLNNSGDQIVEFINALVDAFTELSSGAGIQVFLGILTGFFKALTFIMRTPILGDLVKGLIALGAAMYAISIIRKFPGISNLNRVMTALFSKNEKGVSGFTKLREGLGTTFTKAKSFASSAKFMTAELVRNARAATVARLAQLRLSAAVTIAAAKMKAQMLIEAASNKIKAAWTAVTNSQILANIRQKIATIATTVAEKVAAAATKIWAGVMLVLNAIMDANIFALIVIAIVALVAAIVIAYKKSDTFKRIVQAAFRAVGQAAKWLWEKAFKPAFKAIVEALRKAWNYIKPTLHALWKFIVKDLIPVIKIYWTVWKTYYTLIFKLIKFAWDNVIRPVFKALWSFIKTVLVPVISNLWSNVVKPTFNFIGDKIRSVWQNVISPAFNAIRNFIKDRLIPAFNAVKDGVVGMWNKIRDAAKAPVRFVIETIYNQGIRKALNLIPGVDLGEATVPFARGGVIPGYSPGRDIHKFYSPTAGMNLNLSGGEAVMRPEFTRLVGGAPGIEMLNRLARKGKLPPILEQSHAKGGIVYVDGEKMSIVAAKQLALAEKLFGVNMRVIQGSYQPPSSYSGTSHTGGGVMDTAPGSFAAQAILRKVGFAAWARNIPGAAYAGSGAHVHSVSLLDPAAAGNSQAAAYRAGGDGLGGSDYGPRPPIIPNILSLLPGALSGALHGISNLGQAEFQEKKEHWWNIIGDVRDAVKNIVHGVDTMTHRIATNEWYGTMRDAARSSAHSAVQWANDKIPDKIEIDNFKDVPLPDNPIPNPFDGGGMAYGTGWMAKGVVRPERVLSPRQTEAFERLVDALDRKGGPGGGNINVMMPHDASAADVINRLVYELRRMNTGGRYQR